METYTIREPGMPAWMEAVPADRVAKELRAAKDHGMRNARIYRDSDLQEMLAVQDEDGDRLVAANAKD